MTRSGAAPLSWTRLQSLFQGARRRGYAFCGIIEGHGRRHHEENPMPLYEYQCSDCTHTFDLLRSHQRADEDLNCPVCGSDRVRRKISVVALRLEPASNSAGSNTMGACCGGRCGCASHGGQG